MAVDFRFYQSNQSQQQNNEQKTVEFVHIHQMHRDPRVNLQNRSTNEIEQVARSQLGVANEIMDELAKNPNCFIMCESLTMEDLTCDEYSDRMPESSKTVKTEFPNGLPNLIDATFKQKIVLCELGAVGVLLCLKKIKSIYKDRHKAIDDEINSVVEKLKQQPEFGRSVEVKQFVFDKREKDVMECIKEIFNIHRDRHKNFTFLVVCGAAHKFEPHCVREGFSHRTANELITQISHINYAGNSKT